MVQGPWHGPWPPPRGSYQPRTTASVSNLESAKEKAKQIAKEIDIRTAAKDQSKNRVTGGVEDRSWLKKPYLFDRYNLWCKEAGLEVRFRPLGASTPPRVKGPNELLGLFSRLPAELRQEIQGYLSPSALSALSRTSTLFRQALSTSLYKSIEIGHRRNTLNDIRWRGSLEGIVNNRSTIESIILTAATDPDEYLSAYILRRLDRNNIKILGFGEGSITSRDTLNAWHCLWLGQTVPMPIPGEPFPSMLASQTVPAKIETIILSGWKGMSIHHPTAQRAPDPYSLWTRRNSETQDEFYDRLARQYRLARQDGKDLYSMFTHPVAQNQIIHPQVSVAVTVPIGHDTNGNTRFLNVFAPSTALVRAIPRIGGNLLDGELAVFGHANTMTKIDVALNMLPWRVPYCITKLRLVNIQLPGRKANFDLSCLRLLKLRNCDHGTLWPLLTKRATFIETLIVEDTRPVSKIELDTLCQKTSEYIRACTGLKHVGIHQNVRDEDPEDTYEWPLIEMLASQKDTLVSIALRVGNLTTMAYDRLEQLARLCPNIKDIQITCPAVVAGMKFGVGFGAFRQDILDIGNVLREFPKLDYVHIVSLHGRGRLPGYKNSLYEVANTVMEILWSQDTYAMPKICTIKLQNIDQHGPSAAWQTQHLIRDSRKAQNVIITGKQTLRDAELFGEPGTSDFGACIEEKTKMTWKRRSDGM